MERRIEQADRDRPPAHLAEDPDEVAPLHRQDLRERRAPPLRRLGEDHLAHREDALLLEEHVLGAAEADPLGAEEPRDARVRRRVGVGADAEPAPLVGPGEEPRRTPRQVGDFSSGSDFSSDDLEDLGGPRRELAEEHLARRPVDRDPVAFLRPIEPFARDLRLRRSRRVISPAPTTQVFPMPRATTAACEVMPAARRQDARRGVHAGDVLGRRLVAHEDHRLALRRHLDGALARERDAPAGGAGTGGQALAEERVRP